MLPQEVQQRATRAYRLWLADPNHPGLKFSAVHPLEPIYSVRIGLHWRALAVVEDGVAIWFWIGSHSDYDQILRSI